MSAPEHPRDQVRLSRVGTCEFFERTSPPRLRTDTVGTPLECHCQVVWDPFCSQEGPGHTSKWTPRHLQRKIKGEKKGADKPMSRESMTPGHIQVVREYIPAPAAEPTSGEVQSPRVVRIDLFGRPRHLDHHNRHGAEGGTPATLRDAPLEIGQGDAPLRQDHPNGGGGGSWRASVIAPKKAITATEFDIDDGWYDQQTGYELANSLPVSPWGERGRGRGTGGGDAGHDRHAGLVTSHRAMRPRMLTTSKSRGRRTSRGVQPGHGGVSVWMGLVGETVHGPRMGRITGPSRAGVTAGCGSTGAGGVKMAGKPGGVRGGMEESEGGSDVIKGGESSSSNSPPTSGMFTRVSHPSTPGTPRGLLLGWDAGVPYPMPRTATSEVNIISVAEDEVRTAHSPEHLDELL